MNVVYKNKNFKILYMCFNILILVIFFFNNGDKANASAPVNANTTIDITKSISSSDVGGTILYDFGAAGITLGQVTVTYINAGYPNNNIGYTLYDTSSGQYNASSFISKGSSVTLTLPTSGTLVLKAVSSSGSYYYGLTSRVTYQSFSYAADQQSVDEAKTAAQNAQVAAQAAQNGTNTIVNSYLSSSAGVIQDSSGNTVLSVAKQASQNAYNANTNASVAATNSQNAYNQAVTATNSANTAATNAANANTNASNAYNQAVTTNTTLGTSAGVVQDSSGTVLQSTRQAVTGITNLQTQISNIQNYMAPTLNGVTGLNGATATTSTSFSVSPNYSGANQYQYKLDNGSWSGWTSLSSVDTNGYFTISGISTTGIHTVYVQFRYNYGSGTSPVTSGKMTFFKL